MSSYRYIQRDGIYSLWLNLQAVNLFITRGSNLMAPERIEDFAHSTGATGAINLDQFKYDGKLVRPAGLQGSGGVFFGGAEPEPRLYISKKNKVTWAKQIPPWTLLPFNHTLVYNGGLTPQLSVPAEPRTALGWKNMTMAWVCVDSMTLKELALYMRGLGLSNAVNLDGGHSTGMWVQNRLVTPHRDEIATCLGFKEKR